MYRKDCGQVDAELYAEAIAYEQLTQSIYQAILRLEGEYDIDVQHNVNVPGRSGVPHQVDVLWRFKQAGIEHTVLIENKNYASNLTLEKLRNFFGVLHDVGNAHGLIVSRTGYQSGAVRFAQHYGIGLKILREPMEADWEGRIKDIYMTFTAKTVASGEDNAPVVQLFLEPKDEAQHGRLEQLSQTGRLNVPSGPGLRFFDQEGNLASKEMRWWASWQARNP